MVAVLLCYIIPNGSILFGSQKSNFKDWSVSHIPFSVQGRNQDLPMDLPKFWQSLSGSLLSANFSATLFVLNWKIGKKMLVWLWAHLRKFCGYAPKCLRVGYTIAKKCAKAFATWNRSFLWSWLTTMVRVLSRLEFYLGNLNFYHYWSQIDELLVNIAGKT